ncbi:hypothetical protein [Nocardia pneumoniae]|uniref:hypothetical protein n=1 Tax=Nocardia pneumoniae TaxID=228601 RepID=UPI000318F189|nr:hypothetical protein [Nocardia pneumoniae]
MSAAFVVVAVWAVTPRPAQLADILDRLRGWIAEDAVGGHMVEPKWVGIAVCTIPTGSGTLRHGGAQYRDSTTHDQAHGDQGRGQQPG